MSGVSNAKEGKWFNARMAFGRAWTNANLGNAEDKVTSVYAYEYGRASDAICDWQEAERGLTKAYELDSKTDGPIHMDLVELARMYHAQGMLDKSEHYFSLAKEALDRLQADTRDAIGYANILAEYAAVLSALGKRQEAVILETRENEIRAVFKAEPAAMSKHRMESSVIKKHGVEIPDASLLDSVPYVPSLTAQGVRNCSCG